MTANIDNGLLLAGDVYARNRRTGGNARKIGNTTSLTIASESETKERISRQKATYGQALDTVILKGKTAVKFTLNTLNKETLAMVLLGDSVVLDAAEQNIKNESVAVSELGAWLHLANDNIQADSVVVKSASGVSVSADDIEVNSVLGWLKISATCQSVQAGESVSVSYKTQAGGGLQINALTLSDYDLELWVDGFNLASQKNVSLHIPSAVVAPTSEIDWFNPDFADVEFGGNVVLADGFKSPYVYKEFNA